MHVLKGCLACNFFYAWRNLAGQTMVARRGKARLWEATCVILMTTAVKGRELHVPLFCCFEVNRQVSHETASSQRPHDSMMAAPLY